MKNPYEPPKSNVTGLQELSSKLVVEPSDRITLILAFLIMVIPWCLHSLLRYQGNADVVFQLTITKCALSAACVLFLYYLRGLEVVSKKPPYEKGKLGVWGVLWRAFISAIVASISSIILFKVAGFSFSGLGGLVAATVLQLFIAIGVVWVLFSSNRRAQVQWCVSIVRGW